jgi:hypothetical protein
MALRMDMATGEMIEEDSFNNDLASSTMDNKMNLVSTITGGAIATVVDAGASIWNSLTPEDNNVATEDILRKVNKDALTVYEENPDTVGVASFIAGSLIPSGLALKGMKMLRAGAKGATWFSDAGKAENLSKINDLVQGGSAATKELRALNRTILRNGVANNVLDAAAAEVFTIGAMSAHPLMEDYFDNPVQNFGISLAFGGVLGGGIGLVADRAMINAAKGAAEQGLLQKVIGASEDLTLPAPNIGQLQVLDNNIKSWERLLEEEKTLSPALAELTNFAILEAKAKQADLFKNISFKEADLLSPEERGSILNSILANKEFSSVDRLKWYTPSEKELTKVNTFGKDGVLKVANTSEKVFDKEGKLIDLSDSVYLPEFKSWVPLEEASQYSRFVSTGKGVEDLKASFEKDLGVIPRVDSVLSINSGNTMQADTQYLKSLLQADNLDFKALNNKVTVDPDDIPFMDALIARARKDPDAFRDVTFDLTSKKAFYSADEIAEAATGKAGRATALSKMDDVNSPFNLTTASSKLSNVTKNLLTKWGDNTDDVRKFVEDRLSKAEKGVIVSDDAIAVQKSIDEAFNSAESKALRTQLKNSHGSYIYAYAKDSIGKRGNPLLKSFTPVVGKSAMANKDVFRVSVNDIVGYINTGKQGEFLVKSPYQYTKADLPTSARVKTFANMDLSVRKANIETLKAESLVAKERAIEGLAARNEPLERIAILTNTPLETVQAFLTGERGKSLDDLMKSYGMDSYHYSSVDKVGEYLSPANRAIRATHNVRKLPFSEMASKIDTVSINNIQREYIANLLSSTKSTTFQKLGETFFGNDLSPSGMRPLFDQIRAGVSELVNPKLGNAFFQSSDFFLRNTSIGKQITYVGKTIADTATKVSTAFTKPIAQRLEGIAKNDVEVIETLTFINVNAGLKGWRDVVDGVLVQKTMKDVKETILKNGIPTEVTKKVEVLTPVLYQGNPYKIQSPRVLEFIDSVRAAGKEAFEMKNTLNRVTGRSTLNDIGLWIPSADFRNKHIAYVWNSSTQQTQIILGRTSKELQENIGLYQLRKGESIVKEPDVKIATKSEQALWNSLNGRKDPLTMQVANVEQQRTGSAQAAIVKANTDQFNELLASYDYLAESYIKRMGQYTMSDTLDAIESISKFNRRFDEDQTTDNIIGFLNKQEDSAAKVRNILLGSSNVKEYAPWQHHNENFEIISNWGLEKVSEITKGVIKGTKGIFGTFSKGDITAANLAKQNYEEISSKLEAAGIPNPWKDFDNAVDVYAQATKMDTKNMAKRAVYAGNAFAATYALRVLDLASPLVNAMSFPILTTLAKASNLPPNLMGAVKSKGSLPSVVEIMYSGMRLSMDDKGKHLAKIWEDKGLFNSFVSEANASMRLSRSFESGLATKVENSIDNDFVNLLSKPADWTEGFLRRKMMFTGYTLAKKMYPDLDDNGATIFARDFMDRAMGNYHSGQRPVMFQGTMGVAMGLFQTYMLTMAQNMYRNIELRDFKSLAKGMMAQSTVFGAGSLPGFDMISETIGDKFSEDNFDLTTGTFRALDDRLATAIIYGLPSSMGPALHTRGDISPRIPSPIGDPTKIAAVNMVGQTIEFGANVANAVRQNGGDVVNSVAQAMSLQSVSRPLARVSEFVTGYSVSKAGDVYSNPEDVFSFAGVSARVLGARTIMEAKAREGIYLDRTYGRIDREARMAVTGELKKAIRNNTLSDSLYSELAEKFMAKNGSPTAWRQAVNDAVVNSDMTGKENVLNKLRPDSPINYMIDSIDGEVLE